MKRIAVFICAISLENQQKNVRGILRAAKAEGLVVYIFTCHLNFMARVESQEGTYNIMRLPDLSHFDGAILMKNTIQYAPAAEELEKRIRASQIPCVSIDQELEGMRNVMVDNYRAQYEMVRHMVSSHGAGRLCFVAGYPGNPDGEERKRGFLDACRDFSIDEGNWEILDGNYSIDSGMVAAEQVLSRGKGLPDAFVCANDQMAIGVIERLRAEGVRVPEQVAVTGFDADEIGDAFHPMLTTVKKGQEEAGEIAVRMLVGKEKESTVTLEGTLIPGESCGCVLENNLRVKALRGEYVAQSLLIRQTGDFIRNMSSDFAEAECLEEFYELLKHYIHVGDMKSCYLCLCDEKQVFHRTDASEVKRMDLSDVNTRYTETSSIPVAYRNGKFVEGCFFKTGLVLPELFEKEDAAGYYVVTPVSYRRCCFGYMVTADSEFPIQSDLFFSWIANVSIALENIRKHILMKELVDRLNEMWVYDAMTKLYNRGGFFRVADEYLEELKKKNASGFLIFLDLDGLKTVNDTLGHEMGDAYIRAMGEVLRAVKKPQDLAMRYGGDEFVLFGECEDREASEKLVCRIEEEMKHHVFGEQRYVLSASIGCTFASFSDLKDLHLAIHEADQKMYALKRTKKAVEAAGGRK